jgi:Zn-dependent protease/CBS domain-containing protein
VMNESLSLGRIAGVRVGINWSVLVIFALIAGSLALGFLPEFHPEAPPTVHWVAAVLTALVFLGSLLAHEVAHAVVAMRNGLDVEGITLWLFGGVAKLQSEARDPGAELRIAGVGPLVSVLLAGLFAGISALAAAAGWPGVAVSVLSWLALINLILAIFNLFPASPLDGGRILRAFLWWRRGDPTSAAITASNAGRVFGFVLVALGLVQFALTGAFGGIWLILIGWFLTTAASAEGQHARVQGALEGVRVADVMTPEPTVVPRGLTIDRFIDELVFGHRYSTFPVVEDGRPVGLISLNRVKEVPQSERSLRRIEEVACPEEDVATAAPGEALVDVLPRMAGCADGRVVVVEGGRVVGILSPRDVARQLELSDLRATTGSARHI